MKILSITYTVGVSVGVTVGVTVGDLKRNFHKFGYKNRERKNSKNKTTYTVGVTVGVL